MRGRESVQAEIGGGMAQLVVGPSAQRYYLRMAELSAAALGPDRIAAAEVLGRSLYAQCCGMSQ